MLLALRLVHVRRLYPNLETVRIACAPAGHGKGPVDGEFGVLRALRGQIASELWVNTLEEYVTQLQVRCDAPYANSVDRPRRRVLAFTPCRRGRCAAVPSAPRTFGLLGAA